MRYPERAAVNDESRTGAEHHREPWSQEEDDQLHGYWDGTEETLREIAELLGRTVEACRQRYYCPRTANAKRPSDTHKPGWLVGYCTDCGRFTDVWCDGTNVLVCEDCHG